MCFAAQAKCRSSAGHYLAKPLFRMIYLDELKQWKVRSFVKLFTILMYS